MPHRELAQKLVAKFGETLTLPDLALDAQSHNCALIFDEKLTVQIEFEDSASQLVLSSQLGQLDSASFPSLLRQLMAANLFCYKTKGATLGLDDESNTVVLSHARSVTELDDDLLEQWVETFVNQAEVWQAFLTSPSEENRAAASVPPDFADSKRIFG